LRAALRSFSLIWFVICCELITSWNGNVPSHFSVELALRCCSEIRVQN
jgi:hypothetical protein